MPPSPQRRVAPAPRNTAPAVIESLEGRRLMSASLLHLPGEFTGNIAFGGVKAATTVTVTRQQGHNVFGVVAEAAGPKFSFRGYLDNDRNLYFVFNGLNFQGHGFGHAVVSAGGKSFSGSEITYQPNGAFPSTISVTATSKSS